MKRVESRRKRARIAAGALVLLAPVACGPAASGSDDGSAASTASVESTSTTSTGGTSTTPASDSVGTGNASPSCTCVPMGWPDTGSCDFESLVLRVEGCPDPDVLCPAITVTCPRPNADLYSCTSEYVYDEDALACALTALRDDTPGALYVQDDEDYGVFGPAPLFVVSLQGDRTATQTDCRWSDVSPWHYGVPSLRPTADAVHFESCLDLRSAPERYACLWAGLGAGVELQSCR